jgi:hypothetical protein
LQTVTITSTTFKNTQFISKSTITSTALKNAKIIFESTITSKISTKVKQILNNESLLVFYKNSQNNSHKSGLFTAKLRKRLKQINESDSNFLVEEKFDIKKIDYSLSANVIIWAVWRRAPNYENAFYAIPINKR